MEKTLRMMYKESDVIRQIALDIYLALTTALAKNIAIVLAITLVKTS